MDRDLAKLVALTAFRSSADINNLLPLLKENCTESDYKIYLNSIALVSADISQKIIKKVFQDYPELEEEFEEKVRKYGQPF